MEQALNRMPSTSRLPLRSAGAASLDKRADAQHHEDEADDGHDSLDCNRGRLVKFASGQKHGQFHQTAGGPRETQQTNDDGNGYGDFAHTRVQCDQAEGQQRPAEERRDQGRYVLPASAELATKAESDQHEAESDCDLCH